MILKWEDMNKGCCLMMLNECLGGALVPKEDQAESEESIDRFWGRSGEEERLYRL